MARAKDKAKAIELRLAGNSYSQIKSRLGVSKSTLSNWLKNYPLKEERLRELRDFSEVRIEKYIKTCRDRKQRIMDGIYNEELNKISPMLERNLFIAGLFLYWGEGSKTKDSEIRLSNTNPKIIRFFARWLRMCLCIDPKKIRIKLYLYRDMDIDKETDFWSNELDINKSQFTRPHIKDSNKTSITYKNGFGHGTCNIMVSDAMLAKRVLMGIRAIEFIYNK